MLALGRISRRPSLLLSVPCYLYSPEKVYSFPEQFIGPKSLTTAILFVYMPLTRPSSPPQSRVTKYAWMFWVSVRDAICVVFVPQM